MTAATSARTPARRFPPDYGPRGNGFNGRVKGVQLAIAEAAEERGSPGLAGGCYPHRDGAAVGPTTDAPGVETARADKP